jgi:hypothetical protein
VAAASGPERQNPAGLARWSKRITHASAGAQSKASPPSLAQRTVSPPGSYTPSSAALSDRVTVSAPAAKKATPLPLVPLPVMLEPVGVDDDEKSVLQAAVPVKVKATLTPPAGAGKDSLNTALALPPSVTFPVAAVKYASWQGVGVGVR